MLYFAQTAHYTKLPLHAGLIESFMGGADVTGEPAEVSG